MNQTLRKWISFGVALALPLTVGAIAGVATSGNVNTWYPMLTKPAWTPPGWLFAPVWTMLYAFMGIASWLIWRSPANLIRKRRALGLYLLQLLLNGAWSFIFFEYHLIGWALIEIALLGLVIMATTVAFHRLHRTAGLLLLPYLLWIAYATSLNAGIVALN